MDQVRGSLVDVVPAERFSLPHVVPLTDLHQEGPGSAGDRGTHRPEPSTTDLHEPEAVGVQPKAAFLQGGPGPGLFGDDGGDQGGVEVEPAAEDRVRTVQPSVSRWDRA